MNEHLARCGIFIVGVPQRVVVGIAQVDKDLPIEIRAGELRSFEPGQIRQDDTIIRWQTVAKYSLGKGTLLRCHLTMANESIACRRTGDEGWDERARAQDKQGRSCGYNAGDVVRNPGMISDETICGV